MLTIITPTYNRGYILKKLYDSLRIQTYKNFEWIIVDDGSTDYTEGKVDIWKKEKNEFEISYLYQENGGKHKAINNAVSKAKYPYVYIIDSDDYMVEDAVESIYSWIKSIDNKEEFVGIAGLRGTSKTDTIGEFPENLESIDSSNLERKKNNLRGDKAEVFKKEVLKNYPFPEFENENFLLESAVWDKIAYDGFKIRWFNKIICITNYLDDGLTKNNDELKTKNFKGYTFVEKQNLNIQKFPYNFLAIGRYLKIAKKKGLSNKEVEGILDINQVQLMVGKFLDALASTMKRE